MKNTDTEGWIVFVRLPISKNYDLLLSSHVRTNVRTASSISPINQIILDRLQRLIINCRLLNDN